MTGAGMKRWSKLQRELYKLVATGIGFQIHCRAYRMDSEYGSTDLPRYWITLGEETIWDYPGQFVRADGIVRNLSGDKQFYPYKTDISSISDLIRAYIDTPVEQLLSQVFTQDHWGLVNILRAADRRIGQRRLELLRKKTSNAAARKIIALRMQKLS